MFLLSVSFTDGGTEEFREQAKDIRASLSQEKSSSVLYDHRKPVSIKH
jgi:hypothetical protein